MVIPDIWIEAGTIKEQYDIAGLNEPHIIAKVRGGGRLLVYYLP